MLLATTRVTHVVFSLKSQLRSLPWPENSPGVNLIEHVWDQMGVNIRDMANPPAYLIELRQAVWQDWDSARLENIQHLVDGIPAMWLHCRPHMAATPNIKWCTQKSRS